jgi:peptidoglycan/xylan/chitin deacetylase (PgdA/CDA1 family)
LNADEFWWDALARLLLTPAAGDGRYAGWTVDDRETPSERHRLYRDLCGRLRALTAAVRQHALDELASRFDAPPARASDRALTPGEVTTLAEHRTIQIGSHTYSHASLATLPVDCQHDEIVTGRRQLESWIGSPVTAFAYPFGGDEDVSDGVARVARDAGVTFACPQPGRVHAASHRLHLPRLTVRTGRTELSGQ